MNAFSSSPPEVPSATARAGLRPRGRVERDGGEEALPLLRRVDVVREGPELDGDHQVEDAHPEKEDDTERHLDPGEQVEGDEAAGEEKREGVDQAPPPARISASRTGLMT